jgi:hypothetical protein
MGKYQLIKPYPSDKVYESSNINKCAKKFYNTLKQDNETYQYFILKNIENNTYYKFAINKNIQMFGGEQKNVENQKIEPKKELETKLISPEPTQIIIPNPLEKRIESLESRVDNLEKLSQKLQNTKNEIIMKEKDSDKDKEKEKSNSSEGGERKRGLIPPPKDDGCIIQ